MTDDIVTRLRKMGVYGKNDPPLPIASEAADEIERLRTELSDIRNEYQRLEMKYIRKTKR